MTTIVAAVDDSVSAMPVLATAAALAPLFGADVSAVQVTSPSGGEPGQAGATATGATARAAASAMEVPLTVVEGDPLEVLLRLAEEDRTAAVVLGARDRPTAGRPTGHLALGVAAAVAKPVVIVPPGARPPQRVRRGLLALAGTPRSARRLQRTVALVEASDIELLVVHVEDEDSIPMFSDQVQYESEAYSTEFLARYLPGAPRAEFRLRIGRPADEILATVEEARPDLLAVGWPQSDDPARGAVAREVVDRCNVPILLVALAGTDS